MVKKSKLLLFFVCIILFSSFASAGLEIVGNSEFQINKSLPETKYFTLQIRNSESFSFLNVTVEDNNIINFPLIKELSSGETKNISVQVFANEQFSGDLIIKGFYNSYLGKPNNTYLVDVFYSSGVSRCDLSIVEGDKVTWNNEVSDDITLRNVITNNDVKTITEGESHSLIFSESESFVYRFLRHGFYFTDSCTVSVLGSSGLINNPSYNTKFSLDINNAFIPTKINVTFTETNYSMNFISEQDGVFVIKNVGNNSAENIVLGGSWFSFSENNFNLLPGYSKTIIYKIKINPLLTNSFQTGKLYFKNLTINGNFDKITETFSVYVESAVINSNVSSNASAGLIEFIEQFCIENPIICNIAPQIIYKNYNDTTGEFNYTMNTEQVDGLFQLWFDFIDSREINDEIVKNAIQNLSFYLENLDVRSSNNSLTLYEMQSDVSQSNDVITFLVIIGMGILIAGILSYLIYYFQVKRLSEKSRRFIR